MTEIKVTSLKKSFIQRGKYEWHVVNQTEYHITSTWILKHTKTWYQVNDTQEVHILKMTPHKLVNSKRSQILLIKDLWEGDLEKRNKNTKPVHWINQSGDLKTKYMTNIEIVKSELETGKMWQVMVMWMTHKKSISTIEYWSRYFIRTMIKKMKVI